MSDSAPYSAGDRPDPSTPSPGQADEDGTRRRIPTDALLQEAIPGEDASLSVLIVADPGLPTRRFLAVEPLVAELLAEKLGPGVELDVRSALVATKPDGSLRLGETVNSRSGGAFSATIVLTEMPRHVHGSLLVAEVFPGENLAALFWPTLGILAPRRRVAEVVAETILRALDRADTPALDLRRHFRGWTEDPERDALLLSTGSVTGSARAVVGMVITNAPWRTVRKLSGALAAATAAGAFGVFYTSIWEMAAALSTPRLLLIGLLAVTVMVLWLVAHNGLWDKPLPSRGRGVSTLYNLSTLLTLFLCVLALYAALFVVILVSSAVVIAPSFMTSVLGYEATPGRYLDIAWLSAALGVVAGGIGSSFDPQTDIRELTHGTRERTRAADLES